MRMSYGEYEQGAGNARDMKGRTKKELLAESKKLARMGYHGVIITLDRCSCGCGGAHADKNITTIKF